jgi:hypothetical protein
VIVQMAGFSAPLSKFSARIAAPPVAGGGGATTLIALLKPAATPACAFNVNAAPTIGTETCPLHIPEEKAPLAFGRSAIGFSVLKRTSAR